MPFERVLLLIRFKLTSVTSHNQWEVPRVPKQQGNSVGE